MPTTIRNLVCYSLKPNREQVAEREGDYEAELAEWYACQPDVWRQFYDPEGQPRCRKCGAGGASWTHEGMRCPACSPSLEIHSPGKSGEAMRAVVDEHIQGAVRRKEALR